MGKKRDKGIELYHKNFETEPMEKAILGVLKELARIAENSIPKKEELKKRIVEEANKAEFEES